MKKWLPLILLLFPFYTWSQSPAGSYKITYYTSDIVKISFQPDGYRHNENVTDAVVLKPMLKPTVAFAKESSTGVAVSTTKGVVDIAAAETDGKYGFDVQLKEGEKIYGGGERALPLNRRGYRFDLYNNPWYGYSEGADNLNFSVPFFTSSEGYGLFFDNGSRGFADIGKTNPSVFETGFVSGEINVFVITGKTYAEILTSYQQLTGRQPLPPRWAMGNFMSRFGYSSQQQAQEIAAKMKAAAIPFNAIIFDLFWFGDSIKGTLGNLDWVNKTKWPDPKKMIAGFKKNDINTILITEPFILKGTKTFNAAQKYMAVDSNHHPYMLTDFYFGYGGIIDVFRKDAQNWIWNTHYKKQIANGVAGWWTDLGEPEKHPAGIMHNLKDEGYNRLFGADEVHNIYGQYWNKMLFEKYATDYPNTRLFHLNRSGFAGSQRFSIFPWSGDISRSWSGLRAQLPLMLGMSMSGIPYIHADAGGFAGGEGDNELYVRWLQFAAFTPIFRPHGTALYSIDPAAFSFPSEPALIDEPYRDMAKQMVDLRYSMLPYNYTLAYRQAKYGEPLVRPLYYQFTDDTTASSVQDEFMWGNDILLAPVVEKGQQVRKYYLPEGHWYNLMNQSILNGANWYADSVVLDKLPILIKEGSFICFDRSERKDMMKYKGDSLAVLYVESGKASDGFIYNDDGLSKNAIKNKQYELINFSSTGLQDHELAVTIKSDKGAYAGKPLKRNMYFTIAQQNGKPVRIAVNGKTRAEIKGMGVLNNTNYVVDENGLINLSLVFTGQPVTIQVSW